jgi:hypothetical protein
MTSCDALALGLDDQAPDPLLLFGAQKGDRSTAPIPITTPRNASLAKTNYSFEKRQREIAKKKKQDDKQARKVASRDGAQMEPAAGATAAKSTRVAP